MTTIRLDAETLAKFQAATGDVVLCNEQGTPLVECKVEQLDPYAGEPKLTKEEWQAIIDNPVRYKLADAWDRIRRGETL